MQAAFWPVCVFVSGDLTNAESKGIKHGALMYILAWEMLKFHNRLRIGLRCRIDRFLSIDCGKVRGHLGDQRGDSVPKVR